MTRVLLPELPRGKEFEEYVSACLQLGGYYIERNIIERDVEEILELDIISTNYETSVPEISLIEAKSGDWGFSDLFKVYGWMNYLALSKGLFIVNKDRASIDFIKEKASKNLNINVILIPDISDCENMLSSILVATESSSIDENDVSIWRFSYWIERKLIQHLTHKRKSNQEMKCYRALSNYYHETSSGIFFEENIISRIYKLYSIFMEFPHITAKTCNELIGNDFDDDCDKLPPEIFKDTFYKCSFNDIQISTFIEHRARLAILKNAVDYLLYSASSDKKAEDVTMKILGIEFNLMDSLPSSFKQGMNTISEHKYFHRYPIFWQWFMWLFGGFILDDYREKEYELLSQKTGIPLDHIQDAFNSYEILFPINDGWFTNLEPNSRIWIMKLFPVPFMGIGANYRRALHLVPQNGEEELPPIDKLVVNGTHTLDDLIKWNNLAVEVLRS